jgi:DNA-binding MarR family transcriptional regulator
METKEELIKHAIQSLICIANLYERIEAMPIPVDGKGTISTREAHTIQGIGNEECLNVTQVAGHFDITKSAASQLVAKLEKKGFLVKKPAPHSNKEFEIVLTDFGWRAFRAHEHFHGKDMVSLVEQLNAFPLSQIATLSVLLEALGDVMKKRLSQHSDE